MTLVRIPVTPWTEDQRTTATNGLRVAAERFLADAKELREVDGRMAQQFERQALQARELANLIDGAATVAFSDQEADA